MTAASSYSLVADGDEHLWELVHRALYVAVIHRASAEVKAHSKAFLVAMARYAAAQMFGEPAERWRVQAIAARGSATSAIERHIASAGAVEAPSKSTDSLKLMLLHNMTAVRRWSGAGSDGIEVEDEPERTLLPVVPVAALKAEGESKWLVESIWGHQGVGVIGGHPKSRKTFLALDLAVAVASGTPCLGRFTVEEAGPVLLFIGEGPEADVYDRVSILASSRGLGVDALPIENIRTPRLLLDTERDQESLTETIASKRPKLLILDPFVRLHTGDENDAGHVSRVLGYLRGLQREFGVAVVLVHHYKKSISKSAPDGLGLRGSGDLHAWGDSNLYIGRNRDQLVLRAEHRSAPAAGPWDLVVQNEPFAFRAEDCEPESEEGREREAAALEERVVAHLREAPAPVRQEDLRSALRVRNSTLGAALKELLSEGCITRKGGGYMATAREDENGDE